MPYTLAEKVLARATRDGAPVRAGEEISARPDFVLAYDFPGYLDKWFAQMRDDYGVEKVVDPGRFAMFIDHMSPGAKPAEERVHQITRTWCAEQGVALFEGEGIGHQVAIEQGYAVPGSFSIHFDGHTAQLGAYGALSIGVHKQILEALVHEYITIKVPPTVRVDLFGVMPRGVMARDVFHHLVRRLWPAFARFQVLELGGPAIAAMSFDERQAITGLAMFAGALTAVIEPDAAVLDHVAPVARMATTPVRSDPDALYSARHRIEIGGLEPIVVQPPSPAGTRDLADYLGQPVDVGYIGSCSSGRIDDFRAAAAVLQGRKVKPGFRLNVVPTSRRVFRQAVAEGLIETLLAAGANITGSTCDLCYGYIATVGDGRRAISTGTLNTPGRMGSPNSEIFLASAATVAATAIEGCFADPRLYVD